MTRAAELDTKEAPEKFSLNPNSGEKSAQNLAESDTATSYHAPLTVSLAIGLNGLSVMKSVVVGNKPVPERLMSHRLGVEKYVTSHVNKKFATPKHALSTVLWDFGQDGAIAQRHVEVELPEELETSLSPLKTEVKLALAAKRPEHVMFNHAQLTALWTNGLNGLLAQRHAEEELQ